MNPNELQLRQQHLLIRSTELRLQLRANLHSLQRPAARVDQIKARLLWLYQNPQWPAGVLALLLILKPKRALSWTGKLWWLWKSARTLRHWRNALLAYLPQR
ncbi:YqjK family protein [Rhodoferax sp.]|uniref:YqjK family protein n=1 Tax=Rhodoferax sp. TaxID=50421 RepID=UPI00261E1FE0|nr:YqjK family protein [Rhodoferax sp.]MDD3937878.1 YqjK family protein [Rhodoferax sp.]